MVPLLDHALTQRRRAATPPQAARPWPLPRARSPRLTALEESLTRATPGERDRILDRFEAEVMAAGTPLVEEGSREGGRIVSFLRRGPAPRGVYLEANRITDPTDPGEARMLPLGGSDLCALSLEMPSTWIASYRFVVPGSPPPAASPHEGVRLGDYRAFLAHAEQDPHCREHLPAGAGAQGPAAHGVLALEEAPGVPHRVTAAWRRRDAVLTAPASGRELDLVVLTHPGAGAGSPLVICLDGEAWLGDALLVEALAAAVEEGRMAPPRLALLCAAEGAQRQIDWACEPAESRALLEAVLALAGPGPGHGTGGSRPPVVVAGQSLGGLFAMLCAVRHGDLVDAVVAQSASLWWPRSEPVDPGAGRWFEEVGRRGDSAPVVLQGGRLEWNLVGALLHARSLLDAVGALVPAPHDLVTGGHDMAWWRRALPGAIEQAVGAAGRARR